MKKAFSPREEQLAEQLVEAILYCWAGTSGLADDERPQPQPQPATGGQADEADRAAGLVQMKVKYDRAMLVAVSKDGAAGVRFFDAIELVKKSGNGVVRISYEWRFR